MAHGPLSLSFPLFPQGAADFRRQILAFLVGERDHRDFSAEIVFVPGFAAKALQSLEVLVQVFVSC